MPEANQYTFTFKEIAEVLVKKQDVHEGLWGIYIKFGIQAANAGPSDDQLAPTAVIPILQVGIQRFDKENNLTVDAAKVNPRPVSSRRK